MDPDELHLGAIDIDLLFTCCADLFLDENTMIQYIVFTEIRFSVFRWINMIRGAIHRLSEAYGVVRAVC